MPRPGERRPFEVSGRIQATVVARSAAEALSIALSKDRRFDSAEEVKVKKA